MNTRISADHDVYTMSFALKEKVLEIAKEKGICNISTEITVTRAQHKQHHIRNNHVQGAVWKR